MTITFHYSSTINRADRQNNIGFLDQQVATYDIDFRHTLPFGSSHNFIWGLGYRSVSDRLPSLTTAPATVLAFDPIARTYDTFSAFAQDEITLASDF